jgi:Ca-activated chloride channel family protein
MWLTWALIIPVGLIVPGFVVVASTSADTLLFDNPHLWWLAGAGPLAAVIVLYGVTRRQRALECFASARLAPLLANCLSPSREAFRAGLLVVAILMVVAGIIGPRWGTHFEAQSVSGIDIVVALDVSRSMQAEDVAPNRLRNAKREIEQQLIDRDVFRRTNRLALMAFAGSTSLKQPLTTDHLAFCTKLDLLDVGHAPRGGTAVAKAIESATDLFGKSPAEATKIILLVTDGEDHEGNPVEAARIAYEEHGIRTFTVAVGDPARTVGARIPVSEGGRQKPLLYNGQIVFSKVDVAGLHRIAEAGGGQFARVTGFKRRVDAIAVLRKTELSNETRLRHKPRYQWMIALALVLLGLEMIIREGSTTREVAPRRLWQLERLG